MNRPIKIERARDFRKKLTESEMILWLELRNRAFMDLKFRRQYVVDGFILDFYCPELRIAVEIDGPIHESLTDQDDDRQKKLERKGIVFFRVASEEEANSSVEVLARLKEFIEAIRYDQSIKRFKHLIQFYLLPSPTRGRGAGGEGK